MSDSVISCEVTRHQLQAYALETLSEQATCAVAQHLEGCAACRAALAEEQRCLAALKASLPVTAPRPGLAGRALRHVKEQEHARGHLRRRYSKVAVAMLVACLIAAVVLPMLSRSREVALRSTSQNQLKQWGVIFKMYANESEGERYPALDKAHTGWVPKLAGLAEKYLGDPMLVLSPVHPDARELVNDLAAQAGDQEMLAAVMAENYAYLGYTVSDADDFEALRAAREAGRLDVEENKAVLPLREGIERFLLTDINNPAGTAKAQSTIPVLIEIAGWKHKKSADDFAGANVLYMDGHVEYVRLGTFPVVPGVLDTLSGLGD